MKLQDSVAERRIWYRETLDTEEEVTTGNRNWAQFCLGPRVLEKHQVPGLCSLLKGLFYLCDVEYLIGEWLCASKGN